jgi:hypothetical protein
MSDVPSTRVLVLTDTVVPAPALLDAIRERAAAGEVRFRVVVLNPARAEVHLLHPERHEKAAQAEAVLHRRLPEIAAAAGGHVVGSVSVRHDPMDAVEETVFGEPIEEIMLHVAAHGLATRLHQDLPHRLRRLGLPVTVVQHDAAHHRA